MAVTVSKSKNLTQLERFLGKWDARLRLTQSLVWVPRGLAAGLLIAVVVTIAARFWPIIRSSMLPSLAAALALAGMFIALIAVWVWRRSSLHKARRFDRAFGLKERMSAAIELSRGDLPIESEDMARRQIEQALRFAGSVHPSEGLPFRPNWREWLVPVVAVAAIAAAMVIPNPQDAIIDQQVAVADEIERQVEELEELREEVLADDTLPEDQQLAVVEALDEAIETLEQGGVTQEEAVAALQAAQEQLRDISEQAAAEQQQALEEASGLLDGTAAQAAAEALAEGNLAAAAEALSNMDLDNLTPEEQQELAQALEDAAEALQGSNPEAAEALQDAAEALQNGDTAGAEAALGEASEAMQGEQASEQVGDIADQVGEGQGEVAQAGKGQRGQQGQGQEGQGEGQGQGNQPGQGGMGQAQPVEPGQGGQQGQGQGSNGSGRGEGEGEAAPGQNGGPMDTNNGPGDGGETTSEQIYDPQRIGGQGGPEVDVPGDPGAGAPTGNEGEMANNPNGQASVPYDEVYGDYEGAVNEAIESGYVPLGLRNLIQIYFGNLDPNN